MDAGTGKKEENVFVGGENKWKFNSFTNWEFWWPSFPILVYFKVIIHSFKTQPNLTILISIVLRKLKQNQKVKFISSQFSLMVKTSIKSWWRDVVHLRLVHQLNNQTLHFNSKPPRFFYSPKQPLLFALLDPNHSLNHHHLQFLDTSF